jgi:hypothetical protein
VDAVRVLVEVGAEIEARASQGVMALHWAAENGQIEAVKALAELGADKKPLLLMDRHHCTGRQLRGMWQWSRRWLTSELTKRHLLLMDSDRCTVRHKRGMWRRWVRWRSWARTLTHRTMMEIRCFTWRQLRGMCQW